MPGENQDENVKPIVVYFPGAETKPQFAQIQDHTLAAEPSTDSSEPHPSTGLPSRNEGEGEGVDLDEFRRSMIAVLPMRQYVYEMAQSDQFSHFMLRMSSTVRIIFVIQMIIGIFSGLMESDNGMWWLSFEFVFAAIGYWAATSFNRVGIFIGMLWMIAMAVLRTISLVQISLSVPSIFPSSATTTTTKVFEGIGILFQCILVMYVFAFWVKIPKYYQHIVTGGYNSNNRA